MKGISPEKMTDYMKTVFWYVFDEKNKLVVAAPDDESEGVAILFLKKEDAEKWKSLAATAPAYHNIPLSVQGDEFQSIYEDSMDYPEFRVLPVASKAAEKFFTNYTGRYQLTEEQENEYLKDLAEELGERLMEQLTRDSLTTDPEIRIDSVHGDVWVFEVVAGIFDPNEGRFRYDDEVYLIKSFTGRETSNGYRTTIICKKI